MRFASPRPASSKTVFAVALPGDEVFTQVLGSHST